eukprot:COSAG01_NODE_2690_length_7247_cov_30.101567_2_plen_101_part_00
MRCAIAWASRVRLAGARVKPIGWLASCCSAADRRKALSRSLRIFGITFQERTCPIVDENTKRTFYIGGLPPQMTDQVATATGLHDRMLAASKSMHVVPMA